MRPEAILRRTSRCSFTSGRRVQLQRVPEAVLQATFLVLANPCSAELKELR
jgi:hypothetical protein